MRSKIKSLRSGIARRVVSYASLRHSSFVIRHSPLLLAFTLIELLTVIAILGILAAIALPTINAFKPNPLAAASRQLLDDLAYARRRAIADHTTVYVVFMPSVANLRDVSGVLSPNDAQKLIKGQFVSYAIYEAREVGSQPGKPTPRYITGWRTLPKGITIAREKFNYKLTAQPMPTNAINSVNGGPFDYPTFSYTYAEPFFSDLLATNKLATNSFPSVAFDYRGSLASPWESWRPISPPYSNNLSGFDCVIPLTTATVTLQPATPPNTSLPWAWAAPLAYNETPAGAWTNFNLRTQIVIDGPTGRARVDRQQIQ